MTKRTKMLIADGRLPDGELMAAIRHEANRGRIAEAAKLAQQALGRGLAEPRLFEIVGLDLIEKGRFEEAIVVFGRGLALEPGRLRLMLNVGLCLLELERNGEAHDVFLTVLRQDQTLAAAHFGFAVALSRLEDREGARREYQFTIAHDPEHAPALAGLAVICHATGDMEGASAYATRALGFDEGQVDAHLTLARLELAKGEFAGAEQRLSRILAKSGPRKPRDAGAARTLLGDALHGLGEHRRAFAAYAEGNELIRSAFASVFAQGETIAEQTRRAAEAFSRVQLPPAPALAAPREDEPQTHVFLVGFPRSGTTLLEQVLAGHPLVESLEERPTLPAVEQLFPDLRAGFEALAADPVALEAHRASYWQAVRSFGIEPRGKVFIDKLPLNTMRLPIIHLLFPSAKILFAVRDPRDVVLSCFRREFEMNPAMFEFLTLEGAARYYDAVMQASTLYREKLPLEICETRYERLVSSFDEQVDAVLSFLGLPWSDDVRAFAERAQSKVIRTPSAPQVRRGLYADALAQWRNYAGDMAPVLPILEKWVAHYGYAPS